MKAFVEKNKHNMRLAKASAKKFMCLQKKWVYSTSIQVLPYTLVLS